MRSRLLLACVSIAAPGASRAEAAPATVRTVAGKGSYAHEATVIVTSGHATTRDWQIGYSYKNGQFRCNGGEQKLTEKGGVYTFELTADRDTGRPRPPVVLFPHRVKDVRIVAGAELEPVITDNFLLLPKLLLSVSGPLAIGGSDAVALAPAQYRAVWHRHLACGHGDRSQAGSLCHQRPEHREAAAFLIANMPPRDLASLTKDSLVENIELAYQARAAVPWGSGLPDELFLNCVLPYASINERRDRWRPDFHKRFLPVVRDCKTPGEAAQKLNATIFSALGVKYHATKRPKPDQSPHESLEAGYASCSGLSILLIDACRAVSIPARFVGTPLWVNRKGNHSWVEVWDRQWRFVGAAEPGPLDRTWFVGIARQADPTKPEHRIYAASFERTRVVFPLVWDLRIRYVAAADVTPFYTSRRKVRFQVIEHVDGKPVAADLTLRLGGRIVARGRARGPVEFAIAGGQVYDAVIEPVGGSPSAATRLRVHVPDEDGLTILVPLR